MTAPKSYDYLIVGAGSAGCVLADRLSANPGNRVAVVEAGGSDVHPFIRMPAGIARVVGDPRFTWDYYTQPQARLDGRRLYWPRGRLLGGSSSINGMCYVRGQPADYDDWVAAGARGWSYDEVLPVFRRSERFAGGGNHYHGESGALDVQALRYRNPLSEVFVHAAEQAGYPANEDFNGARQEGVGFYHVTQRRGVRCSTSVAFLRPAQRRRNLTVMSETLVERVLFDGDRAVGVSLSRGGEKSVAHAGHIVLAGGAVNSPQLLMLSGVGPADHLRSFDIRVVANRPEVGRNLQDHLDVCTLYKATRPVTYDFSAARELLVGARYLLTSSGPGASNAAEAGAFLCSPLAREKRPDIQLHFVPAQLDDHGRNKLEGHGFSLHACFLRPRSRGEIRLRSASPTAHPAIDPQYLSDPTDLPRMIEAVKISRRILNQPAFDPYRGICVFPDSESRDHDVLAAFVRRKAETVYHPVGTCRMGSDADAVVDTALRVVGVDGLSVADASVMPKLVSGNTNAPTIMIAERAADSLLRAHHSKTQGDTL